MSGNGFSDNGHDLAVGEREPKRTERPVPEPLLFRSNSPNDLSGESESFGLAKPRFTRTNSNESLSRFRSAARAVLFSRRLLEVVMYKAPESQQPLSLPASAVPRSRQPGTVVEGEGSERNSEPSTFSNISKLSISPVWAEDITPSRRRRKQPGEMNSDRSVRLGVDTQLVRMRSDLALDKIRKRSTWEKRFIFKPSSPCLVLWDLWTTLAIAYDIVQLPLSEAFGINSSFLDIIEVVTASTWLVDMLLSFMRGYVDSTLGNVEMRPRRIAFHYLRTWFWLDFGVVTLDFFLLWVKASEWLKFFTFLRFFRLLRLVRVIRILKVTARLSNISESMSPALGIAGGSEKILAVFMIFKQLLILVIINHFIACGWYALGIEVLDGWVPNHLVKSQEQGQGYLYFTAFHWSITQFTPASMEVFPSNSAERIFTICAIFLGLVMFSSFVSSMTQSMTHLRQLTEKETQHNQRVRRYMHDNHISSELAGRIMGVIRVMKASKKKTQLRICDVEVFATLPQSLQAQLHDEVLAPIVCRHIVFGNLRALDASKFLRICLDAMDERSVSKSEEVFLPGSPGERMYFIKSGKFSYYCEDEDEDITKVLKDEERVAEVCLWAKWEHKGRLAAVAQSEVLQVNAQAFQVHALSSNAAVQMQVYARLFVTKSSVACGSAHGVNDLWGSDMEVDDIARRAFKRKASVVDLFSPDDPSIMMLQTCFLHWKEAAENKHQSCRICCSCLPWRPPFIRMSLADSSDPLTADNFHPADRSETFPTERSDASI